MKKYFLIALLITSPVIHARKPQDDKFAAIIGGTCITAIAAACAIGCVIQRRSTKKEH